jgi:hypothetical protein
MNNFVYLRIKIKHMFTATKAATALAQAGVLSLLLAGTCQATTPTQQPSYANAEQVHSAPRQQGNFTLTLPGGEYVYMPPTKGQAPSKAFTIGQPAQFRTVVPSQQEEATAENQATQKPKVQLAQAPTIKRKPTPKLDWPKVVVMGDEICVPVLAKSDSPDWKSHLTCVEVKRD